jgi:hypothetical protein
MMPRGLLLGFLLALQTIGVQSLALASSAEWLVTPANPDGPTMRLSLTHDRADNGLPYPLLAYKETWTVRAQDAPTGLAGDEGRVLGHVEWTWVSWKLTVGPRAYRLRVLPSADTAVLIVDWTEGGNAGGEIHAVDVYRMPLDGVSAISAAPVARLRRPFRWTRRQLDDVLIGDHSLNLVIGDLAGPLEFRLDLTTLEWHEVHVASEVVPGIVERKVVPLLPRIVASPADPAAAALPPPTRHPR